MADRRLPAIEKKIVDIKESDIRVRLLGTVIDKGEDFIMLDDGSGSVKVTTQKPVEENQLIRVIGRVIVLESGFEIQSEIIQDVKGIDLDLLKAVQEAGE